MGYRMPAEWEPQAAIWATWPDNVETWPENLIEAQIEFAALARTLAEITPVQVLVNRPSLEQAQQRLLDFDVVQVHLVDIATNDAWARDYAPTFVLDDAGGLAAVDWDYNAWGGKYPPFDADQQVARRIAEGLGIPCHQPGLCFEGGALETNGAGIVLSTRSCAGDAHRNGHLTAEERLAAFESAFQTWLGAQQVVWLPGDGLAGDDTDGHIDQVARFVDPQTVVCAWCENSADPQHAPLRANLEALERGLAAVLPQATVIRLPIPDPIEHAGRRLPASYCNFLITDGLVVVPQFGCPADQRAMDILGPLFPEHRVMGLPSRNLSVGLGSFHCLTQQQPATPRTQAPN